MKKSALNGGLHTLALAMTLISANAFAASTATTSTAQANQVAKSRWSENLTASYLGVFVGPSLGKPAGLQTDDMGEFDASSAVRLENHFSMGYKLNSIYTLGVTQEIDYSALGNGLTYKDPYLKAVAADIIKSGRFKATSVLRTYLPVTTKSQDNKLATTLRLYPAAASYEVGRLTLGFLNYAQSSIYFDKSPAYAFYAGPNVAYQLTPKLGFNSYFEMGWDTAAGTHTLHTAAVDLTAGVTYDLTDKINLNPFLQVYPGGRVNLDATTVAMYISAKLL